MHGSWEIVRGGVVGHGGGPVETDKASYHKVTSLSSEKRRKISRVDSTG